MIAFRLLGYRAAVSNKINLSCAMENSLIIGVLSNCDRQTVDIVSKAEHFFVPELIQYCKWYKAANHNKDSEHLSM